MSESLHPRVAPGGLSTIAAAMLVALAGCADNHKSDTRSGAPLTTATPAGTKPTAPAPAAASVTPSATVTTPAPAPAPDSAAPAIATSSRYAVIDGKKEPVPAVPMGDPATVLRIIDEGKNRNRVMDHLTHISTKIGPRLTGSTNAETANHWTADQFRSWGLTNVEVWPWGDVPVRFDRGPSTGKVVAVRNPQSETPEYRTLRELEFTTAAWSAGTNGPVRGPVVKMPENEEQLEAAKDKLKGAWLLIRANQTGNRRGVIAGGGAGARLRTFAEIRRKWAGLPAAEPEERPAPLAPFAKDGVSGLYEGTATGGRSGPDGSPVTLEIRLGENNAVTGNLTFSTFRVGPIGNGTYDPETREVKFSIEGRGTTKYTVKVQDGALTGQSVPEQGEPTKIAAKLSDPEKKEPEKPAGPSLEERLLAAGPAGFISASSDERVRTGGSWRGIDAEHPPVDPEVQIRQSDYDFINSRLADGVPIEVEFNLPHTFTKGPIPVYDTIAEIRGTEKPDEVVIVSAHLDSWNGPGSMGTTDNGTGSSVTLEAARILMAARAKPKRTIRFILWTGEEQGLLGSAAYVKALRERGELEKISAVFVDDGGTNYEGGLRCVPSMVPYLAAATAPVNGVFYSQTDGKFLDVNVRPGRTFTQEGGSDHASFVRAGVPGFFWDEVGRADYFYGWHTQNDKIGLAVPEYLQQSSTCAAVTAYNLACAPELLARPTPEELPARGGRGRPRDEPPGRPAAPQPAGSGSGSGTD